MDELVDELLLARGVMRDAQARHRDPRIRDFLPDPSCFQDMDKGAKRLADAVQHGEAIAIFGDYDVDGATSAALLALLSRQLGAEPVVHIPDRLMEGYGPSGVALGPVAHVAGLRGLTRAFVAQGFRMRAARKNFGVCALAEEGRLVKRPSWRDLGFALGPRINAGGRVGQADLGVRLLTCTDPE